MANSYTRLQIHVVLTVKRREAMIHSSWEDHLYRYITGIVRTKGQKMPAINGMPDHLHMFIGIKHDCRLSDLVREIKKSSNEFINQNRLTPHRFYRQEGFGAFSHNHAQIGTVVKYIMNQKEHHRKKTFRKEFIEFLNHNEIDFDEKYLFDWFD